MICNFQGKTYLYKGERFWRYNETSKTIDEGYPLRMDRWRGVPENLDAATTWIDGESMRPLPLFSFLLRSFTIKLKR